MLGRLASLTASAQGSAPALPRRRLALVCVVAASGFTAAAAAPAADPALQRAGAPAAPTVRIAPAVVQRGERITVTGGNWARNAVVDLLIGPPRSEADLAGRARTTSAGTFRRYLRISRTTTPGRWVLLGCRRECRVKAVKSFRVTR